MVPQRLAMLGVMFVLVMVAPPWAQVGVRSPFPRHCTIAAEGQNLRWREDKLKETEQMKERERKDVIMYQQVAVGQN